MNETLKTNWLTALRSGKYKQGRFCLRSLNNKHCCLGVLCDIIDPSQWERGETEYTWGDLPCIPSSKNVGLDVETMHHLAKLNDKSDSFEHIANYIEENL